MIESEDAAFPLHIMHQQFAKLVEPTLRYFKHPRLGTVNLLLFRTAP